MFSKIDMSMVFPHRVWNSIWQYIIGTSGRSSLWSPLTQRFTVFSKLSGKSDIGAISDGLRYVVCPSGKHSFSLCGHLQTEKIKSAKSDWSYDEVLKPTWHSITWFILKPTIRHNLIINPAPVGLSMLKHWQYKFAILFIAEAGLFPDIALIHFYKYFNYTIS